MQKILGEFVTVEMTFHAKALEIYTTAYQHIQNVDEEGDLEVSVLHQHRCSGSPAGLSLSVLMSNQIIFFLLLRSPCCHNDESSGCWGIRPPPILKRKRTGEASCEACSVSCGMFALANAFIYEFIVWRAKTNFMLKTLSLLIFPWLAGESITWILFHQGFLGKCFFVLVWTLPVIECGTCKSHILAHGDTFMKIQLKHIEMGHKYSSCNI